ncbi:MAG: hypothetical protein H6657_27465 [Ardenticatenaceae bacterium]|nr:hypothetical protein [Ardenticatenaceae bacterium]
MNRRLFLLAIVSILFVSLLMAPTLFAGLIHDGSFENKPTDWEEYFNTICMVSGLGDWTNTAGLTGNYDGNKSLWVGGKCNNGLGVRNNGASQTITLEPDAAVLSFWYAPYKFLTDGSNQDNARVFINDEEIWTLTVNGPTGPAVWKNALINISQYAGQEVTLAVEMDQNTNPLLVANVFFDFFEVYNPALEITQQVTPANVLIGESFTVDVTINNSGDIPLNNLTVSNSTFSSCNQSAGSLPDLAPGESIGYACTVENAVMGMANTASVLGTATELLYPVETESFIAANVVNPQLELIAEPPTITVSEGEAVNVELTVTNIGNTKLTNVQLSSAPSVCSFTQYELLPAQESFFTCTFTPEASGTIHFAATAVEPLTNKEIAAETAVAIEVEPVDPPTVPVYTLYLPITFNNVTNHNDLGEPNNSCDQSFPLQLNQPAQFLAEDVYDWYGLTLDATSNLTIKLTNFVPIAGQITVWRGSCDNLTFLGQNGDFATTKTIQLSNQPPGNYSIWIINDGPTNTNQKYTLTVSAP